MENISERILSISKDILEKEGYSGLTMRKIAKGSNIAIGTIYNYYSSKDEIILALVENFWEGTFTKVKDAVKKRDNFASDIKNVYSVLSREFASFSKDWLGLLGKMETENRAKGLEQEAHTMQALCSAINTLLASYYPQPWRDISKDDFSQFVCSNILSSLTKGDDNIDFLINIAEIVIINQIGE